MQKATVVVQRVLTRLRRDHQRPADRASQGRRPASPNDVRHAASARPGRAAERHASRPDAVVARAQRLVGRLGGSERVLPIGVAGLVLVASILSVAPASGTAAGANDTLGTGIGNTDGAGTAPRLAIGGQDPRYGDLSPSDVAPAAADGPNGYLEAPQSDSAVGATPPAPAAAADIRQEQAQESAQPAGPYLADGTLLKPVAVDTTVADGSSKLRAYTVREGDTLTGIASRFGVSMMTIWWANDLTSKDALHIGQKLVIPPVSGVVVKVKVGDTLASIAADTGAAPDEIIKYNGLTDPNVILGQVLVIPGAQGDAIPTPQPPTAPDIPSTSNAGAGGSSGGGGSSSGGGGTSVRPPSAYSGGRLAWPVPGGYISQYFHYGHWALDIAADYGTPVLAAAAGTVTFAGWKNNGGGYQVWIAHGSDLYTTYNHMSAVSVGVGQSVGRGQQVGRVGATGDATGPHCHFEVWIGPIWDGGSRVNPMRYL